MQAALDARAGAARLIARRLRPLPEHLRGEGQSPAYSRYGYSEFVPEYSKSLFMDFVRHPRARRYVIRVRPDGSVRVTVPRWGSRRHAELFAEQQRHWIERQQAQLRTTAPRRLAYTPEAITEMRRRARHELPATLLRLAAHHGLHVSRISVRNQRSRWGSCSDAGWAWSARRPG